MKLHIKEKTIYYGVIVLVLVVLICGNVISIAGKRDKQESGQDKGVSVQKEATEETAENPDIRVLIKTDGFRQIVHDKVQVTAKSGVCVQSQGEEKMTDPGEMVTIRPDDAMFQEGPITISASVEGERLSITSLKRGCGTPSYRGKLELYSTAEGIVIINELPLESYLYGVVPSEMPASYELEALKAQAVCARSYAWCHMEDLAYPEYGAHVDDSTAYQVYGNSDETDKTIQAVNETRGKRAWYQGQVVKTYYYSTSCGKTAGVEAWGTMPNEKNAYLSSVEVSENGVYYEKDLPWFRWTAEIPEKTLSNLIGLNTGKDIGDVQSLEVTKRGPGEIALAITATGSKGTVTVETENKIRRALGGSGYQITRQDGSVTDSRELLPSAFFSVEHKNGVYYIHGGGYGHGVGMSQNGANEMAKCGKTYEEILKLFYSGIEIR